MNRSKLFANKALHCYKSIFEDEVKFNDIIVLANKYDFLFPTIMHSYAFENTSPKPKIKVKPLIKDDYIYLNENFFYGIYKPDPKDKSKFHQIKRGIWEKIYDYFLTMGNIINFNGKRNDINFGGYFITLDNAWWNCYLRTFLILRSILNKSNIQKDDISLWRLKCFTTKTENKIFNELNKEFEKVLNLFKFDSVFKTYVNKIFAHTTSWNLKTLSNDENLVSLNSAFNLFECLYIITKIVYWLNSDGDKIYDLMCDAENYDGDLLHQQKICEASKLYYENGLQVISNNFSLVKVKKFCVDNKIDTDFNNISNLEIEKIHEYIFNEFKNLKNNTELRDFNGYAYILWILSKAIKS